MYQLLLLTTCLWLTSCRSIDARNRALVADRAAKLSPLSTWRRTECRVDLYLTAPATARYRGMFRDEVDQLRARPLSFAWTASEARCEIRPLDATALAKNVGFLVDQALCTLVETHLINSPFDELKPVAIEARDQRVFVRTGTDPDLGIYLEPGEFRVETHTRGRGLLLASYEDGPRGWLPRSLSQIWPGGRLTLDQFEYNDAPGGGPRAALKKFQIGAGEREESAHSRVEISGCERL